VALDIALQVCVAAEHQRVAVKASLQETFSSGLQSDGRRGFFHPDNFTFGQHVYLSQVVARQCSPGVNGSPRSRFQRWAAAQGDGGRIIRMSGLEIPRLDNDQMHRDDAGSLRHAGWSMSDQTGNKPG